MDVSQKPSLLGKQGSVTAVLLISLVITGASILYIVGRIGGCLVSLGCPTTTTDILAFAGVFNPIVLFPVAIILARRQGKKILVKSTIVLAIVAALPAIVISFNYGSEFIAQTTEPWSRAAEIKAITSQVQIARQANITFESGLAKLTKVNETPTSTEYELIVPLVIKNIPLELKAFNVGCEGVQGDNNHALNTNKYYVSCSEIKATRQGDAWQYVTYDKLTQKEIVQDKPVLRAHIEAAHKDPLPPFKQSYIFVYIPASPKKYGAGMIVEDVSVKGFTIPIKLDSGKEAN